MDTLVRYATGCSEIFSVNTLRGKLHQLGTSNLGGGEPSLGPKLASF